MYKKYYRNLKIMPQIWKCYCEYNNVSHNVNIICSKTIVPDCNAYKSNCRTKVSLTLNKIYLLTTHINNVLCARKSNTFFMWWICARHDHYRPWNKILWNTNIHTMTNKPFATSKQCIQIICEEQRE